MWWTLPPQLWPAFTDVLNFWALSRIPGLPLVDYWVEFPPLYPWLAKGLFWLAQGHFPRFLALHWWSMTLFQAAAVYLMAQLVQRYAPPPRISRVLWYTGMHLPLLYTWGYFDSMVLFFLLLALKWAAEARWVRAGFALATATLTKWFPLVVLPAWVGKGTGRRRLPRLLLAVGTPVVGLWVLLALTAPQQVAWSWQAQTQRPPWETPWALLFGRLTTGLLGSYVRTQPPVLDTVEPDWLRWLPWILWILLGSLAWRRFPESTSQALLKRSTWWLAAFFLTAWGYSPQWVLYTLPGFLLLLPWPQAAWWSALWLLVHVFEWPILLSRGWFQVLWFWIPLRLAVLLLGMLLLPVGDSLPEQAAGHTRKPWRGGAD